MERKIDELGRIVLPIELRRELDLTDKDTTKIEVVEHDGRRGIFLSKYKQACIVCGNEEDLSRIKNKYICNTCKESL